MLTIKNYHKLCDKPIGRDGWKVLFSAEGDNHYEIKLVCTGKTSVTIYLERKPTKTSNGRVAYMFRNGDGELTQFGVTPDWILDMGNMLKALDRFTC
jgi:hypothetical protein